MQGNGQVAGRGGVNGRIGSEVRAEHGHASTASARGVRGASRRIWLALVVAVAATVTVAVAAHGVAQERPARPERSKTMPEFMVLMLEDDGAWAKLSPEEQEALLKRYYAWVGELRESGAFREGRPLSSTGRVLQIVDGAVVDGPFTETKEVLTGYFVIAAESLEAAVEIARGCPALTHGEKVIVRPVGH